MILTPKQKKEAYKKLSPEAQDFIMSNETTELIGHYLIEAGLSKDQSDLADSEILYAMFDLQTPAEAVSSIAKLSGKNIANLSKLKNNLDNNIFGKMQSDKRTNTPETGQNQINSQLVGRIEEVGKKYSLNDNQIEKLTSKVAIVIKYPAQKNSLVDTLITELNISRLLAEQIVNDLEARVFEYAIKEIESKKTEVAQPKPQMPGVAKPLETKLFDMKAPEPRKPEVAQVAPQPVKVPEKAPNNLPMVEKGEMAHNTRPQEKPFSIMDFIKKSSTVTPAPKGAPATPVQTPPPVVPVQLVKPEMAPAPKPIVPPAQTFSPSPARVITPQRIPPTQPVMPQAPQNKLIETKPLEKAPENYRVDPYREPLN